MKAKILLTFTFIAFGFIVIGSGSKVFAGTCSYVGSGGGSWNNPANWDAGCTGALGVPGTNDDITIPADTSTNNDLVGLTLNSITFDGIPSSTQSGNAVTIVDAIINAGPPNPITISFNIILGGGGNVSLSTNNYSGGVNLGTTDLIAAPTVLPWGISGPLSGSGDIIMNDVGSMVPAGLSSGAAYSGNIIISGDSSVILGSNFTNANVQLNDGGTLSSTGMIGSVITDGTGRIQAYDGVLVSEVNVATSIILTTGDTYAVRLVSAGTAGQDYDTLNADFAVLGGATLSLTLDGGYIPAGGDTFTIVSGTTGITGTFAGLPDGAIISVGGLLFEINYTSTEVTLQVVDLVLQFQSFDATPTTTTPGSPVTISLQLGGNLGTPTGTVSFFADGNLIGTVSVNGSGLASLTISDLPLGINSITADYSGDGTYPAATSGGPVTVTIAGLSDTGINLPINLIAITLLMGLGYIAIYKKYE